MPAPKRPRRGVTLIYCLIIFVVVIGFVSLGADWGHVQLAKSEMETATVAAARYGAVGLQSGSDAAIANALAAAASNTVDGTSVELDTTTDIQFGSWSSSQKKFTQVFGAAQDTATAIKISSARSLARGNAVGLTFARILGQDTCDVNATAIAVVTRGTSTTLNVSANSNPYLAGEPAGTASNTGNPHNNPDYAGTAGNPQQSPAAFSGVPITSGKAISFDEVSGGANNFPGGGLYTADGNLSYMVSTFAGSEHGMSALTAPINAVVGVFLTDALPDSTGAPSPLDFTSDSSRDFTTLTPQIKQVFFIGDGRRADGEVQQFIVPPGATRLFIGIQDGYEWNNNVGGYTIQAHNSPVVSLVR